MKTIKIDGTDWLIEWVVSMEREEFTTCPQAKAICNASDKEAALGLVYDTCEAISKPISLTQ